MQHLYRRYAYCDNIELQNIKILHSCRDWEFERWLNIIGIDVKSHLEISEIDTLVSKGSHFSMLFGSFFQFERQFSVIQNNKKLVISHCPEPYILSEIAGAYKKSRSNDIMIQTEFKSNSKSPSESYPTNYPHAEDRQSGRHKFSIGKIASPHIEPIVTAKPQRKKLKGMEVDESF